MTTTPTKLKSLIHERNTLQTLIEDEIYIATNDVKEKHQPKLDAINGQINKTMNDNKGQRSKMMKAVKHSMRHK